MKSIKYILPLIFSVQLVFAGIINYVDEDGDTYYNEVDEYKDVDSNEETTTPEILLTTVVYCESWSSQNNCELTHLNENFDKTTLSIEATDAKQIKELNIADSSFSKLTSVFCEIFPNLEKISIKGASIEEIDEDAFDSCTNLRLLDIRNNNLQSLEVNTFSNNLLLEVLYLNGNKRLTNLHENLLKNLIQLKTLDLSGCPITQLPAEIFRGTISLTKLCLHHCDLEDLDVETLYLYAPNLDKITLRDNNIRCDRMSQILQFSNKFDVKVGTYIWALKSRTTPVSHVNEFECIGPVPTTTTEMPETTKF